MKLLADLMVFFGAILLTAGTDLVIETAGQDLASLGGLLGVLLSVIGVSLLTAGILSHRDKRSGLANRRSRTAATMGVGRPISGVDDREGVGVNTTGKTTAQAAGLWKIQRERR
jgi:hypothetical protein